MTRLRPSLTHLAEDDQVSVVTGVAEQAASLELGFVRLNAFARRQSHSRRVLTVAPAPIDWTHRPIDGRTGRLGATDSDVEAGGDGSPGCVVAFRLPRTFTP